MNLLAASVVCGLFLCAPLSASQEDETLRSSLAPRLTNFRLDLHHILEGSRIRKKRRLLHSEDESKIKRESPDSQTHVYASPDHGLSYLSDYNMTFWIGFQHQSKHHILIGTQEGRLILFKLSDIDDSDARTVSITLNEAVASKAMAFSYYDEQWFAIKQSYGNSTWIRFYQRVDRGLEGRQTIVLEGEADFDLVTVKGVHYLAVVTSPNQSMLTLYHWTQTQFDRIASRTVRGARSVACWVMDGSLYMAVAQEGRASPVYFYNAKGDGELVLLQMLDAEGPRKVMHFYASGGHYVAFVGRRDATIYWWSNDQFLRWQTIAQTAFASDASVLALDNGEAMIVIALQEEALFYAVDASGRFVRIFSMHLSGYLASMQFMYSGKNHYALVFLKDRPQLVWKLIMDSYYMPTAASLNPLQQCLQDLDAVLGERQGHIDAALPRLRRVWLRNGRQNVTAEVVVTEVTSSTQPSDIALVLVISLRKTLPSTSIPAAENAISNIQSIVDGLLRNVKGSVLKSGTQTIAGNKQFTEAIAVPFLNLESTSRDVPINGIPVSRIGQFALRKFGNQTLWYPAIVEDVQAEDVLANALNGILVDDLLLLGGDQEASGTLKFSKIFVSDVLVASVNSIYVDDFVTVGSNQMIGHLKTVSVLRCSIIYVQGYTNGENLEELNQRVVSILDDWEIKGRLSVESVLHIAANVFLVGSLNGVIDVNHLDLNSVKKHTEQNLKGHFIFTSECNVFEYVYISGYVNNVDVGQLVTLSTPQIISGDVVFGELLTLDRGLAVDYVNDVDLNRTAIVKMDEPQFVTGFVSFVEHLQVEHIAMTEYVTLDAVDPSMFVQDIVKHEAGVVKNDKILFRNVVVLGDIVAIDGINGYKISDLPNVVWLKSNTQVVEMPVTITKLTAKADLEAKLVNRLRFDTDLVHSFRNESITSVKTFINDVSITDHIDLEATLINGLEVTSLKNEMDRYVENGKIYGQKFLRTLEIYGDISADILNNLQMDQIMQPHTYQEVQSDIKFISELMVVPDLVSGNVNLNTFKNIHLQEYISNVVLKTNRKYTIANKIFSIIRASNLIMDNESTIGGTKFSEMVKRVVTLDTRQEIIARKTFPHDLHLHSFSNVSYLNDRDWRRIINNIVFAAESSSIESFKTFTGTVTAGQVLVHEFINGINVTLMNMNTFFKSRNNVVGQPIILTQNVKIGDLEAKSSVEGLQWNDFIYIRQKENLNFIRLLSDAILTANIQVDGLINGCDINKIVEKVLYANKTSQFIKEKIFVQNMEIEGNLHLKKVVNQISVEELQQAFIPVSADQVITSNVVVDSNLGAYKLILVDYTSFEQIVQDAVRHSITQEISGYKRFKELNSNTLSTQDIFINDSLNGIDINGVFNNAVLKTGHQDVVGEKIFNSLNASVVAVEAYINGLRLPDDVVRIDTDEHITSFTIFMSDLTLGSDLNVFGKMNQVDVLGFIFNRVALTGEQFVSSPLSFVRDVSINGDFNIDETVNGVVLGLACKIYQDFPLDGSKVFLEDFNIIGSLFAPSVNGHDTRLMDQIIIRYNKDEHLSELQVFDKQLVGNSLSTEMVNGKSLSDLINSFILTEANYNGTLSFFDGLSYSLVQQLNNQMLASGNRLSRFSHFLLVQEIDIGPITKILLGQNLAHVSKEFSHTMVLWTTKKQCSHMGRCCHSEFSYWMRISKSGRLMIDGDAESGRYYPLQNPFATDRDLFFWTNEAVAQSQWCNVSRTGELVLSFKVSGETEVLMRMKSAATLSEARFFRRGRRAYIVAGFYFDRKEEEYSGTVVYVFNEVKGQWMEHEFLPSYGTLSLDVTHDALNDQLLLAVGTGMGTYSTVYRWNDNENGFNLVQNIPPKYVTSTIWLKHGTLQLLAMSSVGHWPKTGEDCVDFLSGGQVDIYAYHGNVEWIQSIPLRGVVSMLSLNLAGDTFLVAASHQLQSVFIYEWKGYAGFSLIQSMFVEQVRHLNAFTIDGDVYVTVAVTSGSSKLMKVILQGEHAAAAAGGVGRDLSLRKRERPMHDEKLVSNC